MATHDFGTVSIGTPLVHDAFFLDTNVVIANLDVEHPFQAEIIKQHLGIE